MTTAAPSRTQRVPSEIGQHRAADELRELAADLHRRRRPPSEILVALHTRARLLASADGVRLFACLPILRELPGLERYDPIVEAERVEAAWRCRAQALSEWLKERAGSAVAERVVRLIEADLEARQNGGK